MDIERKDNSSKSPFYRATHCQITLREPELVGTYQNLKGMTCEIQVCSLLAHVFNEIEHDLAYKPLTGATSESENGLLDILGNLTKTGDSVVTQLLQAVNARHQSNEDAFTDQYDFVARTRDLFADAPDFAIHAGQLFDELLDLGTTNPNKLQRALLHGGYQARSAQLADDLNRFMQQTNDSGYVIDRESSDRLLMLLLESQADRVIDNHQAGRGYGRAPRIYSVARRFQKMREQQPVAAA